MKNSPFIKFVYLALTIVVSFASHAQVGINTVNPDNSAVLDLGGTERGILIPRLTRTQREAISAPVEGLLTYDVTDEMFYYFNPKNNQGTANWQGLSPFIYKDFKTEPNAGEFFRTIETHRSVKTVTLFTNTAAIGRLQIKGGLSISSNNESPTGNYSLLVKENVNIGGDVITDGNITISGKITAATIEITGGIPASAGVVPVDGIIMWSGSPATIPSGWALCDGQSGRPDLRGRFIVGYDPAIPQYNNIGNSGGSPTDTTTVLTEANLASHSHSGTTNNDGNHSHSLTSSIYRWNQSFQGESGQPRTLTDGGGSGANSLYTNSTTNSGAHAHGFNTNNTGSGLPFDKRPPYYVLAYIIRVN
jgi:microcystin-dependent protein